VDASPSAHQTINKGAAYLEPHKVMNIHSGAVCWICLEGGGADDAGKPIVRDCACRGSDAGFAHMSCIIGYAEQKSAQATLSSELITPWKNCPICKKSYQNDLAIFLAEAFVSFAERKYDYPGNTLSDKILVMEALKLQILSIRSMASLSKKRVRLELAMKIPIPIRKMMGLSDRAIEEHGMKGWVHMDHSTCEFKGYCIVCSFKAYGYVCLGQMYILDTNKENESIEIGYYDKARDIYNSVGLELKSTEMSELIRNAMAKYKGDDAPEQLEYLNKQYHFALQKYGEKAEITLTAGISYAFNLLSVNRSIEAERIMTKVAGTSLQIYGQGHQFGQRSFQLLRVCKRRFIHNASSPYAGNASHTLHYLALRYENDGEVCIIYGPTSHSRFYREEIEINEKQTCGIASALVIPSIGCPVICHGLINASHLNGKLGDVRSISVSKGDGGEVRLGVCFEDKSLKSAAVKPENLRIAFVLPSV
jgi:hypothetical protein